MAQGSSPKVQSQQRQRQKVNVNQNQKMNGVCVVIVQLTSFVLHVMINLEFRVGSVVCWWAAGGT
jgi:hypothetical protein